MVSDWYRKLAPLSQPIRCETKTNSDLVTHVSSCLRPSTLLHVFTLSSHWLLVIFIFVLIGRCVYFGFGFTMVGKGGVMHVSRELKSNFHGSRELKQTFHKSCTIHGN